MAHKKVKAKVSDEERERAPAQEAPRKAKKERSPAVQGFLDALMIVGAFFLGRLVAWILDITGIWPIL